MLRMRMVAALALGAAGPAWAADVTEADLMEAATRLGHEYDVNYNAKNADAMAALYAPGGVLVSPGPVVHGADNLKTYYQGRFTAGGREHLSKITEVHVFGDGGYGVGQFFVTVPGPAGQPKQIHGNLAMVYQHGADGWRFRMVVAGITPDPVPVPAPASHTSYDEPITDR